MVSVSKDWEDNGRLSTSGDTEADGEDSIAERRRDVDVPSPGGGNGGYRNVGGGDLCISPSEHRHKIYCDKAHYGPVSGGGAVPRVAGFEAMMVTGGN